MQPESANSLIAQWANSLEAKKAIKQPNSPISLIGASKSKKLSVGAADTLMNSVSDLVSPAYKPKYYKAMYRLGGQRFYDLAERARGGKYPPHLFRYLIDNAN